MRRWPEKSEALTAGTGRASIDVTQDTKQGFNMSDSTEVQVSSQAVEQMFCFEGFDVRVLVKEGEPWFVASDLCKALHLTNSRVALKALAEDEKGVSSIYTHGGAQDVAVVNEAGMWTLVLRCRDAVIEGTVPYRVRRWVTHEVLPAIRKTGVYVGKPFAVNPGDVLTQEEQNTLRLMLKTVADRQPKAKQAAVMVQGWSKLKAHFKVGYREIPRHEFSEAVSIIARHAAEWEVVDEEPLLATDNERIKQAFALASEVAQQAAITVFNAVVDDNEVHKHDRWMFHMDWHAGTGAHKPWAKPIQANAMVVSMADLPGRLLAKGSMLPTNQELADLAAACNQRLAQRMQHEASKSLSFVS